MKDDRQDNMRDAFETYLESAPDGLWDGVQEGLVRVRRRRRIVATASGVSAFAAILAAVLLLSPDSADGDFTLWSGGSVLSEAFQAGIISSPVPVPAELALPSRPVPVPEDDAVRGTSEYEPAGQPESGDTPEIENPEKHVALEHEPEAFFEEDVTVPGRPGRAVAVGLSASGMPGSTSSVQGLRALSTSNMLSVLSGRDHDAVFQTRSSASDGNYSVSGIPADLYSSVRHHQPLRLELTASREIGGGFFLSGGLSWSMLVSDMSSGSSSVHYDSRQTLHYLGVPLYVGMSFPLSERLDLSLSAGGMAAKCIYGTVRTDYIVSGVSRAVDSERIDIGPLQWSAQLSASLGWKFSKSLGVFIKPGLAYHFDDGSSVSTIYKDRPFNFDLALGLRLYL